MSEDNGNQVYGRLSIVETKVNSFEGRFDAVFTKLDHIETALSERNKTNWGLILSALAFALLATSTFVGVLVAFNAAKVSPLETDMIRARGETQTLALAVLNGITPVNFRGAVVAGDIAGLSRLKGVGKKTAERIVVELKDKIGAAGDGRPYPAES